MSRIVSEEKFQQVVRDGKVDFKATNEARKNGKDSGGRDRG